jgi:hypothetical protein
VNVARMGIHNRVTVVLAVVLTACSTLASPLKAPKRMINGHMVELTPLFKWWAKHDGQRPLMAWVHITGKIVGTNGWDWVVEAQIEKTDRPNRPEETEHRQAAGPTRIVLREPPTQDRAEFEQLSAQLKTLNAQHAALAGQETDAKNRADALNREEKANRRYGVRSPELAAEHKQATQVENQAKQDLKPLAQQIQELKKKLAAYPNPDHFEVDCFALETLQQYSGMPLYDHGQVF